MEISLQATVFYFTIASIATGTYCMVTVPPVARYSWTNVAARRRDVAESTPAVLGGTASPPRSGAPTTPLAAVGGYGPISWHRLGEWQGAVGFSFRTARDTATNLEIDEVRP
jgi:hypothetical protein